MALLAARFAALGQTVCDPRMQQQAGTALGATEMGCTFIGAADRQTSVDRLRSRLSAAQGTGWAITAPPRAERPPRQLWAECGRPETPHELAHRRTTSMQRLCHHLPAGQDHGAADMSP